jgi:hypothetical protein
LRWGFLSAFDGSGSRKKDAIGILDNPPLVENLAKDLGVRYSFVAPFAAFIFPNP